MLGNFRLPFAVLLILMLTACDRGRSTTGTTASNSVTPTSDSLVTPASDSLVTPTSASKVDLSWSPPVTRADGSYLPANELAGYRVYMGTSSNNLSLLVDLNDEATTTYTISNLPAGSYYIAVSAYDSAGVESGMSQVIKIVLA
jgi:hypothetical protein